MPGNFNSGRRPRPTGLKVLEGNPGRRPLNELEPRPRPVAPECPGWLHPLAKEKWPETVKELEYMGTLASSDQAVLAAFCQSYARWQIYEMAIDVSGPVYETAFMDSSGNEHRQIKPHPAVKMAKDEKAAMKSFAMLLGLDPSSRSRLSATAPVRSDSDGVLDAV